MEQEAKIPIKGEKLYDEFVDKYGSSDYWSPEVIEEFHTAWESMYQTGDLDPDGKDCMDFKKCTDYEQFKKSDDRVLTFIDIRRTGRVEIDDQVEVEVLEVRMPKMPHNIRMLETIINNGIKASNGMFGLLTERKYMKK